MKVPLNELVPTLRRGMQDYGLGKSTISMYVSAARHVCDYMEIAKINCYDATVGVDCCSYFYASGMSEHLKKIIRNAIRMLNAIIDGKPYSVVHEKQRVIHKPPCSEMGQQVEFFVSALRQQNYSSCTISGHLRALSYFTKAMENKGIQLSTLNAHDIRAYIGTLQKGRICSAISIRAFLKFLYGKGLISENLTKCLYNVKEFRAKPVLTYYSPTEVSKIEKAIDRSTKRGKRDYAIILLASRLGLRMSDITRLTFQDIDWDANVIRIVQFKTKRKITLPLLADVGDAIIDYVKNGRPIPFEKTNIVFLSFKPPYPSLSNISSVAQKYICKANVDISGRHKGLHSLRHSLATSLMNEGATLHVISAALGHRSTESTMCYLGVSMANLLRCSLDVSLPSDNFYTQRGGVFYE